MHAKSKTQKSGIKIFNLPVRFISGAENSMKLNHQILLILRILLNGLRKNQTEIGLN